MALWMIVSRSLGTLRRACCSRGGPSCRIRSISWKRSASSKAGRWAASSYRRQTQAINVGPCIAPAFETVLGPCNEWCPRTSPVPVKSSAPSVFASPKSVTQTFPPAVQQQVRRLDVAMEDTLAVRIFQRFRDLDADASHGLEVTRLETRLR